MIPRRLAPTGPACMLNVCVVECVNGFAVELLCR